SLPKIGRFYSGRHHTTVLHAVEKIEKLRKTDEAFDALLDVLTPTLASEGKQSIASAISSAHSKRIEAVATRRPAPERPPDDRRDNKFRPTAITEGQLNGASNRSWRTGGVSVNSGGYASGRV